MVKGRLRPQEHALELVRELVSDTKAIRKVVSRLQGREGRGFAASVRTSGTADAIASFNAGDRGGIDSPGGLQGASDANELRETLLASMEDGGDAAGGEAALNAYQSSMFSVSPLQRLQAELHLLCCESEATSRTVSEVVSKLPTEKLEALLSLLDALSDYSLSDLLRIAAYGTLRPPTSREQSDRDARLASHAGAGSLGAARGGRKRAAKATPRGEGGAAGCARTGANGTAAAAKTGSPRGGGRGASAGRQAHGDGDDGDEEDEKMQRRRMALNKFRKGALAATSGLFLKRMLRVSDEENAAKVADELADKLAKLPPQWAGPSADGALFESSLEDAMGRAEAYFGGGDARGGRGNPTPLFVLLNM